MAVLHEVCCQFTHFSHSLSLFSLSYVTATYVVEAMAAANAYQKYLDESKESQVLYSTEEDVAKEALDEKVHLEFVNTSHLPTTDSVPVVTCTM